jgi:hypothetical protein
MTASRKEKLRAMISFEIGGGWICLEREGGERGREREREREREEEREREREREKEDNIFSSGGLIAFSFVAGVQRPITGAPPIAIAIASTEQFAGQRRRLL